MNVIHNIWFGPNKVTYDCYFESVRKFLPGWSIREWSDSDLPEIKSIAEKIDKNLLICFEEYAKYPVILSDVSRLCILHEYGGIYSDYDAAFRSFFVRDLIEKDPSKPFFVIERYISLKQQEASANFKNRNGKPEDRRRIVNSLIYSPKNNSIIKSPEEEIKKISDKYKIDLQPEDRRRIVNSLIYTPEDNCIVLDLLKEISTRLKRRIKIEEDYDVLWLSGPDVFSHVINRTSHNCNLLEEKTEPHFGGGNSTICEFFSGLGENHWRKQIKTLNKKEQINVVYIGNFSGPTGYANAIRGYFKILSNHPKISIKTINVTGGDYGEEPHNLGKSLVRDLKCIPDKYTILYHIEPGEDNMEWSSGRCGFDISQIIANANKKIAFVAWEPKGIPPMWKTFFDKYFDELITFCHLQKDNLSSVINKPVHLVPHSINLTTSTDTINSDKFRILSMSQWSDRKGFDILIQAFLCEFFEEENIELTIKTFGQKNLPYEKSRALESIKNFKLNCMRYNQLPKCQIKLWWGGITSKQIDSLYQNIDLYATTTRGEGFGLTIAEALMKGKRVVVPDQGGHLDYIHESNYFIKSRWESLRCAGWSRNYSSEMKLVEPDFEDTRLQLRKAYEDFTNKKQEWANKQEASQKFTMDYLSENKIKNSLERVLGIE